MHGKRETMNLNSFLYPVIHDLLADRHGAVTFRCFGIWHLGYIAAVLAVIAAVCLKIHGKDPESKRKAALTFIHIAFGLYIADFFLMPFAYEQIDMEKLPFHICTAMCVMCFLSRHVRFLSGYRMHFALLGFLSNLVYLIYPAGVMWYGVHPLCYRVVQTLLFHGMMTAYGFLTILYDEPELQFRTCRRDLAVIAGMNVWAVIGNLLYTGTAGSYSHRFNWFFVLADPFGILNPEIAPFLMPVINIVIFFAADLLIIALIRLLRAGKGQRRTDLEKSARNEG
jgi:hypothetical protein